MTTPTLLSDEEMAPLLQRKRQLQADLASQNQSSCGSGGCCGSQSSCASSTTTPLSSATDQPNVLKALLITGSVLAVIALAWWA